MQLRLDWRLALVYTLLVLQAVAFMLYVASSAHYDEDKPSALSLRDSVSFVGSDQSRRENRSGWEVRTILGETSLKDARTSSMFRSYNGTQCWLQGVDDRLMRRQQSSSNRLGGSEQQQQQQQQQQRCICEAGWHGTDCGQPEVVWRAIMASKQMVKLRRRKYARRLIYTFELDDHNSALAEIIVEELYPVVDLFVVADLSAAEDNLRHKLAKGFLAAQQDKILYVNVASKTKSAGSRRFLSALVWDRIKKTARNLRDDDLYVSADPEQILNSRALMFLKVYDGWPQPIGFRLRYSVFGFFWQHPHRTTIAVGASTVGLTRELRRNMQPSGGGGGASGETTSSSSSSTIVPAPQLQQRDNLGLVIGDLNHYGGWYCQFCQGPANVVVALQQKNRTREISIERGKLDVPFVEELIGSGLWFDEKTSLLRASRSSESYYAPETVMNQTWKYDWLVENFYAKLDYY